MSRDIRVGVVARAPLAIMLCASIAVVVTGCHNISKGPLLSGFSVGDTVSFPLRITEFDPVQERVKVRIGRPANLIALEVFPGKSITIVDLPSSKSPRGYRELSTIDEVDPTSVMTASAEYTRCVEDAARLAAPRPQAPRRPPVKRDPSGKALPGQSTEPTYEKTLDTPVPTEQIKSACRARVNELRRALNKQLDVERYVLILASDANFTRDQLIERLSSLSVVASDVRSTMDAIATGIFAARAEKWSGYTIAR